MNRIQWCVFGFGFGIMTVFLDMISVGKNKIATSMISIDSSAFVAWKIIGDMSFLFQIISMTLAIIFLICASLQSKEKND